MSIDITKLTDQDIRKFKREIEGYERNKRLFLILGFVFLGITLFLMFIAILFFVFGGIAVNNLEMDNIFSYEYAALYFSAGATALSFASTFCIATIAMFIVRSVAFAKKTENRLAAIEEYEIYKKQPHEEEKPIETEVAEDIAEIK